MALNSQEAIEILTEWLGNKQIIITWTRYLNYNQWMTRLKLSKSEQFSIIWKFRLEVYKLLPVFSTEGYRPQDFISPQWGEIKPPTPVL